MLVLGKIWIGLLLLALVGSSGAACAADPDALWKIVHDRCVPDQRGNGKPDPCAEVDIAAGEDKGYSVLKDLVGDTQYLLIPTARISGIESAAILDFDATNYFAAAWRARSFVSGRAGRELPRDWVSLAINSELGRSQNQFHIHIDCIRADVRDAIHKHLGEIGSGWAPFPEPFAGHHYEAMAVEGDNLDSVYPLQLLASGDAKARADMGDETLVVAGTILSGGQPGFVLLAHHADPAAGDKASGEELQDHSCALLHD